MPSCCQGKFGLYIMASEICRRTLVLSFIFKSRITWHPVLQSIAWKLRCLILALHSMQFFGLHYYCIVDERDHK